MAAAMPGRSLNESSIDDPSPSICRRPARIFSPRTYEIAICMPILQDEGNGKGRVPISRWYAIGVHADSMAVSDQDRSIKPLWKGNPSWFSSFAALDSILYRIGPCSDVCKRDVNGPTNDDWIPVPSMNTPRCRPHRLVLGSKLYVLGSDYPSIAVDAEVFDPITNKWEDLPDPPYKMEYHMISAVLENPNRILVASLVPDEDDDDSISSAIFFVYDVGHGSWNILEPAQRKIHPKCPLGSEGMAVAVANFLYWITGDFQLLCYDLDLDFWFLRHLDGLLIPDDEPDLPGLVHLENHRFCILQCPIADDHCSYYVQCNIFDVTHMPEEKSLGISVVWAHKYTMEDPTTITDCLLLGK